MKALLLLGLSASLLMAAADTTGSPEVVEKKSKPKLDIKPILKLSTKAEKALYENGSHDNIDDFYGRVTFGMKATINKFIGKVEIRAYPSGFGYELMRGIQDEEDVEGIDPIYQKVAKFQVNEAYAAYRGNVMSFGIGRSDMFNSNGAFFGNYVDEGPGGYFTGKGISGNFMKFLFEYDLGETSVILGSNDPNLNEGYLRIFQDFNIMEHGHVGIGVKNNLPDEVHSTDSTVFWNTTLVLDYAIKGKVKVFGEVGFTDFSKDDEPLIPVVTGVQFPLMPLFSDVALEAEFLKAGDRPEIDIEGDVEQMDAVQWGVNLEREINRHFHVQGGLYSERKASEVAFGLKLKVSI